jgi:hypothetical protein
VVDIPPLEMVDDIVTAVKCGENSTKLNNEVNNFIEKKKLKLSVKKCANIHIGNKASRMKCQSKYVDGEIMKESDKEKYLGDYLTTKANSKDTIAARKTKGYAILSEMSAILKDVPLGNRRTQIGIDLRKAWFINGCLFNSEVWSAINDNDLKDLKVIDHKILRLITGAQAKVPLEMLYLETAQLPLSHVISVRRILYWQNILKRAKEELLVQVYTAMKNEPLKGDWIHTLKDDLKKINMSIDDEKNVRCTSTTEFKAEVKARMRSASFAELEETKMTHKKVDSIVHIESRTPQQYLTDGKFSNAQKSILFNLRSRCENNFKYNFKNGNQEVMCPLCKKCQDTQEHGLTCEIITQALAPNVQEIVNQVSYDDIFGDLEKQHQVTVAYQEIIRVKKRLLAPRDPAEADPGTNSGPSG